LHLIKLSLYLSLSEKVATEDESEETQNIEKLSQQETIPIGSNSLETEEVVPSDGNINKDKSEESNDDFHNFDVFTEGTNLKDKDNITGSSIIKECTGRHTNKSNFFKAS